MEKISIIVCLLLIALCAVLFLAYKSRDLRRDYESGVRKALALNGGPGKPQTGSGAFKKEEAGHAATEKEILSEEDVRHLPDPVRKYLVYTGAVGKEKVRNVKISLDGEFKIKKNSDWTGIRVEQHNFFGDHLMRFFYMKLKFSGIPVYGLHTYTDEVANMRGKIAGLITIFNVAGPEMRISDTLTQLNDMCLFAPGTLADKRIAWEPIDDFSARAIFKTKHCTVSAVLYFNEEGELVNFVTEDRYFLEEDGSCRKARWSTPIYGYEERNGFRLVSSGEAVWNFPEGDYCYIKFTKIRETSYNLSA